MSTENEQTIAAYEKVGGKYCETHRPDYDERARAYFQHQTKNLERYTAGLPKDAKIFEIGSANGRDAKILEGLGFQNITLSDATDLFLDYLKNTGYAPIKFNLLEDNFPEQYDFILCWAVLVHFTKEEVKTSLKKIHDALADSGRAAISVKLMTKTETEWAEHRYEYGVKRFFSYWREDEFEEALSSAGFKNIDIKISGSGDYSWLECYAEK